MKYKVIIEAYPDGSFFLDLHEYVNEALTSVASESCDSYDDALIQLRRILGERGHLSKLRSAVDEPPQWRSNSETG